MAYRKWTIGGLTPSWVEPDFIDDRENNTLTLKCMAGYDETGADPMVEVEAFDALTSEKINNDSLLNGGTKLQVRGQIVTVTATNEEGTETKTWERCAIRKVKVNLDSYYNEDNVGSIIEYELVITYQTQGDPGGFVYYPDYEEYSNIDYYFWYKPSTGEKAKWDGEVAGTEIGHMTITETQNVRRVEVYGGGDCVGDNCYIECNGDRRYWHYGEQSNGNFPQLEKLTWDLDTPANTIVLNTDEHWEDMLGGRNYGCYLAWVRVIFASE